MHREVTVELKVTLNGDYIPEGEEIRYIAAWIDMGLYDREDVAFCEFNNWKVSTERETSARACNQPGHSGFR